jgi:hypothetical protein
MFTWPLYNEIKEKLLKYKILKAQKKISQYG